MHLESFGDYTHYLDCMPELLDKVGDTRACPAPHCLGDHRAGMPKSVLYTAPSHWQVSTDATKSESSLGHAFQNLIPLRAKI